MMDDASTHEFYAEYNSDRGVWIVELPDGTRQTLDCGLSRDQVCDVLQLLEVALQIGSERGAKYARAAVRAAIAE